MKETVKTSRAAGQLEKMFRALNAKYFNSQLEEVVITLQKTPGAYGHITCGKTWQVKDQRRHEINISTATLDRPIENVTATLLHEMVHLWNIQNGVQDCSRGGSYHNKKFRDEAVKRDLDIQHHPTYGWTLTQPTEALLDFIIENEWQDFKMNNGSLYCIRPGAGSSNKGGDSDQQPTRKPSSTRKYICPCCKNSVRATKAVNIICGDCMKPMILA